MCVIDLTTIPDPMGGGLLVGASAAFHAALWKKNEWEKVVKLLQLYSDEPPPPAGVNCYLHRKLLFTIAMSRLHPAGDACRILKGYCVLDVFLMCSERGR